MRNEGKRIRLAIITITAVFLALAVGAVVYSNTPYYKLGKQLALGDKYLNDLDYEQAVAAFKEALSIDPKSDEAVKGLETSYYEWSFAMADRDRYDDAADILKEAADLLPRSDKIADQQIYIYEKWAEFCYNEGNPEEAVTISKKGYDVTGEDIFLGMAEEYGGTGGTINADREEAPVQVPDVTTAADTAAVQVAEEVATEADPASEKLANAKKVWGSEDIKEYIDPTYGVHFFLPSDLTVVVNTPFYNADMVSAAYYVTGRGMTNEYLCQVQRAPVTIAGESIEDELYGEITKKDGYAYSINFLNPDTQYDFQLTDPMIQFIRSYRKMILNTAYVE